jgi:hypothetical protein
MSISEALIVKPYTKIPRRDANFCTQIWNRHTINCVRVCHHTFASMCQMRFGLTMLPLWPMTCHRPWAWRGWKGWNGAETAGSTEIPTTKMATEEMKCYNTESWCQKSHKKTAYTITQSQYLFFVLRIQFHVARMPTRVGRTIYKTETQWFTVPWRLTVFRYCQLTYFLDKFNNRLVDHSSLVPQYLSVFRNCHSTNLLDKFNNPQVVHTFRVP